MLDLKILAASEGKNLELSTRLASIATELGFNVNVINLVELDLPLYHSREESGGVPTKVIELANELISASAYIIVAPEYNGLIPPVLNNSIAWISRSSDNWREAFNGKVCAIATHSGGGGAHALTAMRQQLSYIGSIVLGRQLLTNFNKPLNEESAVDILNTIKRLVS